MNTALALLATCLALDLEEARKQALADGPGGTYEVTTTTRAIGSVWPQGDTQHVTTFRGAGTRKTVIETDTLVGLPLAGGSYLRFENFRVIGRRNGAAAIKVTYGKDGDTFHATHHVVFWKIDVEDAKTIGVHVSAHTDPNQVDVSHVVLDELNIWGTGSDDRFHHSIYFAGNSDSIISNCTIRDTAAYAIHLWRNADGNRGRHNRTLILNNTISDCQFGVLVSRFDGCAVIGNHVTAERTAFICRSGTWTDLKLVGNMAIADVGVVIQGTNAYLSGNRYRCRVQKTFGRWTGMDVDREYPLPVDSDLYSGRE